MADRVEKDNLDLHDLVALMQALRQDEETRKIRRLYWQSYDVLGQRIKTGNQKEIVEGLRTADALYRRIVSEIEEFLALRPDGIEIGKQVAPVIDNLNLDRLAEHHRLAHNPAI